MSKQARNKNEVVKQHENLAVTRISMARSPAATDGASALTTRGIYSAKLY
jgi:hypothetical protein